MPHYVLIEAPSNLGLKPTGVERTPTVLQELGLGRALAAPVAARVEAPPFRAGRDPATGMLNPDGLAAYTPRLADAVGAALAAGSFPVVLGGDCSVLLGCALALNRRGRHGLFFVDGHADFYDPVTSVSGEAADMDLGLVTGRGPALLADIEGRRPYLRDEDAVVFGYRDAATARNYGARDLRGTAMTAFDLGAVRAQGAAEAAGKATRHLAARERAGFWIHLDADVLDDRLMPAVDYRAPDGLSHAELVAALRAALATGRAVGLDLTIYNPNLDDADLSAGRGLVAALVAGLRPD